MSYRGDDEPEYIDDDEYYDPDDLGGSGRPGSTVLGGSGARQERNEPRETAGTGKATRDRNRNRGSRPAEKLNTKRATVKTRNSAPSVASSEERRARLAGKKSSPANRKNSESRRENGPPRTAKTPASKDRFSGLRARLSRSDEKPSTTSSASGPENTSRFAAIAGGLGGRLGGLRERLGSGGGRHDRDPPLQRDNEWRVDSEPGRRNPADRRQARGRADSAPRNRSSKAPRIETNNWLDLDRKLDLIGVALVFGAILLTFSALSQEQAAISAMLKLIGQALGWGAFALPVTMFGIGLWLIIRHFGENAPTINPIRLTGVTLAFLGVLVLFQFVDSFTYGDSMASIDQCRNPSSPACVNTLVQRSYQSGRGGGLVGGWVYGALVNSLTELGAFVIVLMVLTIGAMMLTRLSMAELAVAAISLGRGLRTRMSQYAAQRRTAQFQAQRYALAQQEPQVRVSKPQAAQLSGSKQKQQALPQPTVESMPIPLRLRELFSFGRKSTLEQEIAPVPLAAEAVENSQRERPGRFQRFFTRRGQAGAAQAEATNSTDSTARDGPAAARLERFLNLGDNLPSTPEPEPAARVQIPTASRSKPSVVERNLRPTRAVIPEEERTIPPSPAPGAERPELTMDDLDALIGEREPAPPPTTSPPAEQPSEARIDDALDIANARSLDDLFETVEGGHSDDMQNGSKAEPIVLEPEEQDEKALAKSQPAQAIPELPRPRSNWDLPDFYELLNKGSAGELDREPLLRQAQVIEDTLASFGAPGRVVEINSGPVITQYGVEPAYVTARNDKKNRVKVSAIANLDKDLQLALGARSIRIEAPVPGKGFVGIEVPNPDSTLVSLRDVMESRSYQQIDSPLAIALGMSVDGTPISADLTQMPHLLIAGTTGSGKSKCINAIIISILATRSPDEVKFIMVDPKRVELTGYNGLPHLVAPVVVELERTVGALRWVTTEMDERYKKFSRAGARNIIDYNSILDPDAAPMPYIVVIIDELADLMMMAPDDTERAITRIAALARATGIHLVIATQRPSVDVVTGLIKANCPARIAFAVAGSVDSRVILDQPGADRLLGKGDMLYLSGESPAPLRMQGVFVSDEEILRISRFWKLQGAGVQGVKPITIPAVSTQKTSGSGAGQTASQRNNDLAQTAFWDMTPTHDNTDAAANAYEPEEDELYQTAVDMVRRLEKASVSLLQRRLRIGYTRAARLVDMMEERGVVGPPKEGSSKPRDVLPPKASSE